MLFSHSLMVDWEEAQSNDSIHACVCVFSVIVSFLLWKEKPHLLVHTCVYLSCEEVSESGSGADFL